MCKSNSPCQSCGLGLCMQRWHSNKNQYIHDYLQIREENIYLKRHLKAFKEIGFL